MNNDAICFADVELPFHVWIRERTAAGYRWVLRERRLPEAGERAINDSEDPGAAGPD